MKKIDFEKHKFDTRWKFFTLILVVMVGLFLQYSKAPMANEFIALIIGLIGREAIPKTIL